MIASTELVFDQIVRNAATEHFSSPRFDELLGASTDSVVEIEVEEATGSPTSITVKWYHSNSGKGFVAQTTIVNGESISSLPYRQVVVQNGPYGKLARLGVTLTGGSSPTARVRIWHTGRERS